MNSRHLSVIAALLFFGCSDDNSTIPNGSLALPPTVIREWGSWFNSENAFVPRQAQFKNNVLTFLEDHRFSRYTVEGTRLSSWTWANPSSEYPVNFDQDAEGNVYTAFHSRHIRVESPGGTLIRSFPVGNPVAEAAYYPQLGDIALDGLGHLYVADIRDRVVRKYDVEGNLLLQWGGRDPEPGYFQEPTGLIVHTNGNVIVLDPEQRTVQIFDPTGVLRSYWYVSDDYPNWFYPGALVEGATGTVFVLDQYQRQGHVREYALDGTMIREWGSDSDGFSYFDQAADITADRQGTVFVCDEFDNRVIAFSETGQFLHSWETRIPSGTFASLRSVAAAPDGSIFSLEGWRGRVQKFSSDGGFILQWGSPGQRVGQLFSPKDLDIDDDGNVFVADPYNQRVTKFDGEGQVLGWWQSKAEGMAVSPGSPTGAGSIYEVYEYILSRRSLSGTVQLQKTDIGLENAIDVTMGPDRHLYVLDASEGGKVVVTDENGNLLGSWSIRHTTLDDGLSSIAVDTNAHVLITNPTGGKIGIYTTEGRYLATWAGGPATNWPSPGIYWGAAGLDVDAEGNILLADWKGYRIRKFAPIKELDTAN